MEIKQQITRLINNLPDEILVDVWEYLKEVEKEVKEKQSINKNDKLHTKQVTINRTDKTIK